MLPRRIVEALNVIEHIGLGQGSSFQYPRFLLWECNAISPRGVYDQPKRFTEAMTMAYQRHHGLDTRIGRFFNAFGPRMWPNNGRVVSSFVVQASQGRSLTIFGDGSQIRSFCYCCDIVRGIIALLLADSRETVDQQSENFTASYYDGIFW